MSYFQILFCNIFLTKQNPMPYPLNIMEVSALLTSHMSESLMRGTFGEMPVYL